MSVLDSALHVGLEVTYGTPVALTRSFEAETDGFKRDMMPLVHRGFRAGQHADLSTRQKMINGGGTSTVRVPLLTTGMGMLLRGLFGTVVAPAQQGATPAYLQTYAFDDEEPTASWTMQMLRALVDATTTQPFTHHGCVATGWTFNQEKETLPNLEIAIDFEDVDTSSAAGTATYPTADMFSWDQCAVTLNAAAIEPHTFSLNCDLKLDTSRRHLRGSPLKKRPRRNGIPEITGSMVADFTNLNRYTAYANGTTEATLEVAWTGAVISGTHNYDLRLTMPVVMWQNEGSPEASLDSLTTQPLNFKVLHNITNPAITCAYKSTDVTA